MKLGLRIKDSKFKVGKKIDGSDIVDVDIQISQESTDVELLTKKVMYQFYLALKSLHVVSDYGAFLDLVGNLSRDEVKSFGTDDAGVVCKINGKETK